MMNINFICPINLSIMKKIRTLQILVYITFVLFFVQNYAPSLYRGFADGWTNSVNATNDVLDDHTPSGPALDAVLQGNIIPGAKNDTLRVGKDYLLRDVNITADIRVVDAGAKTPEWLKVWRVLLAFVIIRILLYMASFSNRVVVAIYNGRMFEPQCIKLIRKIGVRMIIYAIADFAYQWTDYIKQTILIHAPLKVINTVTFDFGLLLSAMLVFILAEAFKQGGKLKEEQELTI
jgi:hypothetical protein